MAQNCCTTSVPLSSIPSLDEAVLSSEQHQGGILTRENAFGNDPLSSRMDLMRRREYLFAESHPGFEDIFSDVVSSNGQTFLNALHGFGRFTERLIDFL